MSPLEETPAETDRITRPLPETTQTLTAETIKEPKPQSWLVRSGIARRIRENWSTSLAEETREKVQEHYTILANALLRDVPLTTRAKIVTDLTQITKHYLSWEKRPGAAHAGHHPLFGSTIHLERRAPEEDETWHEAIHVLQQEGCLPFNHALTYAVTAMARLTKRQDEFVKREEGSPGVFRPEFLDQTTYLQMVKDGRAHEAFVNGWILHPRDDEVDHEFRLYLEKEADFENEFAVHGELTENRLGLRRPYGIMMNVGLARGERAYALGLLSGNLDNAWSVLYLHARGMPFEEAEKAVIATVESGRENKLTNFRPLKTSQVEKLAAYEEIYQARKLWEEKFPEKMRPLIRKLRSAKDIISEYALALKQSLEKVSPEEIRERHELFSRWRNEKKSNGTIDLSKITDQTEAILNRSLDTSQEVGANLFVFPDKEKKPNLSMTGVRLGLAFAARPRVYSQVFAEQLGTVHTHPYYDAPPSVPDLVNLALNDREVFQIIRSANALYLAIKPLETALANSKLSQMKKMTMRSTMILRAIKELVNPGADREMMMVRTAQELNLETFKAESPEYASLPRRIGLSNERPLAYQVNSIT